MHKYINNHRIHTLVALEQENLYYTHETRDTSNTIYSNIITVFRSAPMKNANPDVLSTVRILYPPRMAGRDGFVNRAVCMGETLLRNAIYRNTNPKEAAEHFRRRYEEGDNIHAKYFKDNYDDMRMNISCTTTPGIGVCVSISLYFEIDYLLQRQLENTCYGIKRCLRTHMMQLRTRPPYSGTYYDTDDAIQEYCKHDCEVTRHLYNQNRDEVRQVGLLDTAPPNFKKLCNCAKMALWEGNLTGVPVVSITREAVKEYNELEAKYQSACGQISEYEEENRKLKEKLEEISKLVKSAMPDWDPRECLRFMGEE